MDITERPLREKPAYFLIAIGIIVSSLPGLGFAGAA